MPINTVAFVYITVLVENAVYVIAVILHLIKVIVPYPRIKDGELRLREWLLVSNAVSSWMR